MILKDKYISISILDVQDVNAFLNMVLKANASLTSHINRSKYNSNLFKLSIHYDIMDNKFVPNFGIDMDNIVYSKKFNIKSDTHLMVDNPIEEKYIEEALKLGSDSIIIHYESKNFDEALKLLKKYNLEVGVSIKPNTDIKLLKKYEEYFSKILVMTVEPGFGAQKYIEDMNNKLEIAKEIFPDKVLQIDGGINEDSIVNPISIGVDIFSIGSYFSKSKTEEEIYSKLCILNIVKDIWTSNKVNDLTFRKNILQIVRNGYGEKDLLIGLTVPQIRDIVKKYINAINYDVLDFFIASKYHEYRQLGVFYLTHMLKKVKSEQDINSLYNLFDKYKDYFNNWDLTDEVSKVLGKYLLYKKEDERKKILKKYLYSENIWNNRLAIVSMLEFIKVSDYKTAIDVCDQIIYSDVSLINRAVGWILRETYKKDRTLVLKYLEEKVSHKKISSIILSYACEKMNEEEKKKLMQIIRRNKL